MGPKLQTVHKESDVRKQNARSVEFGREVCGDLRAAETREWLVTNGIGGFSSGTVAGLPTRRYHGLLIAALKPPLDRKLLVSHMEETVVCDGRRYDLSTCRWAGDAVSPGGYRNIEEFRLEGTTPVWTFACADALIEKRIWMEQGTNTTYVTYRLARGCRPVQIECKALVNYRDYHASTHGGGWRMNVEPTNNGVRVIAFDGATPFYLLSCSANADPAHDWYHDFDLAAERHRGLDDHEDHLHAATFRASLSDGETLTIAASTEASANLDGVKGYRLQKMHESSLLERFESASRSTASDVPAWIRAAGTRGRSVRRQPASQRGSRRKDHHRGLSLVR